MMTMTILQHKEGEDDLVFFSKVPITDDDDDVDHHQDDFCFDDDDEHDDVDFGEHLMLVG